MGATVDRDARWMRAVIERSANEECGSPVVVAELLVVESMVQPKLFYTVLLLQSTLLHGMLLEYCVVRYHCEREFGGSNLASPA